MNITQDLRVAAHWVGAEGKVALGPSFAAPHQALCLAAQSLSTAWSGSWLPGYANLYDRHLHALPLAARLAPVTPPARPPTMLLQRCRVWTQAQVREAVRTMANRSDVSRPEALSAQAADKLDEALVCFHALLGRVMAVHGRSKEFTVLLTAAKQIMPPDREAIIDSWRPVPQRRPFAAPVVFEAPPPHIAELAGLEALLGPFEALRVLANLMRYAAERLETPAPWCPALTPHTLARRLEFTPV